MSLSTDKRFKKLEEAAGMGDALHITPNFEEYTCVINPKNEDLVTYIPYPTTLKFHQSDARVRLIMGPYGSGKSSACCAEILFRAIQMTPDQKGLRRSRWAIIRNTAAELQTTALKTWLDWTSELGSSVRHVDPMLRYNYEFNDGNGIIQLEIMFLALDRPADSKKLKSLELTGAWMNEACEINDTLFDHLQFRVGRYPSHADVEEYWSGVILDTNPPDTSHWIYYLFEEKSLDDFEIYHQPPGLIEKNGKYVINTDADNIKYLPGKGKYYLRNASGKTKEFVRVFCMGEYGIVVSGQRVYTGYNDDIHCVDEIYLDDNHPILLAWDYGTVSPACLVMQYVNDQLRCIKEFTCKQMTVRELYKAAVEPYLAENCADMSIEVIGDPADTYNGREQLEELGLIVEAARTNKIDPRINGVANLLGQLVQGNPRIIIPKFGCPMLRKGFLGEYHYRRLQVVGHERYKEEPNKNHPYSDIHDCLQYGALFFNDPNYSPDYDDDYDPDMFNFDEDTRSKVTGY